jgi:hypothetical protein
METFHLHVVRSWEPKVRQVVRSRRRIAPLKVLFATVDGASDACWPCCVTFTQSAQSATGYWQQCQASVRGVWRTC